MGLNYQLVLLKIEHGDILIILTVSNPGNEFSHNFFIEIVNHSEFIEALLLVNQLKLESKIWIILSEIYDDGHLIGIIVEVDEAIIEEEATVAFFAITVIDW